MTTRSCLALSVLLASLGCATPQPAPAGDAAGADGGATTDARTTATSDTGTATGPLRLEILDPVPGQVIPCEIEADSPMICSASYHVRARVVGTGAADVVSVDFGTTATLGFYPTSVVDGPEGRVAEATVLVGRDILGSGMKPESVGVRVDEGPSAPETDVAIIVDFR